MKKIKNIILFFVFSIVVTSFLFVKKSSADTISPPHNVLTSFASSITKYKEKYSHYVIFQCNESSGKGEYQMLLYNGSLKISNPNLRPTSMFEFSQNGCVQCDYWANGKYFETEREGQNNLEYRVYDNKVFYSNNIVDLYGKSFHLAPLEKAILEGAEQVTMTTQKIAAIVLTIAVSSIVLYRLLVELVKKLRHFLV